MKKVIAMMLILCMLFSLSACGFNYENLSEAEAKLEALARKLGQTQITGDDELIGGRTLSEDAYTGAYRADCEKENGKDVVFGGASIETRELKVYGTITQNSGTAAVRIRNNWDVTELTPNEDGYFEITLSLESGGSYIMAEYKDFKGTIEIYSEYAGAKKSFLDALGDEAPDQNEQ